METDIYPFVKMKIRLAVLTVHYDVQDDMLGVNHNCFSAGLIMTHELIENSQQNEAQAAWKQGFLKILLSQEVEEL